MKKVFSLVLALALALVSAAPVAAGCDPNRAGGEASLFVEQRHSAQPGVYFTNIKATIEEDNPYIDAGEINYVGGVWQYISLRGGSSQIRLGIEKKYGIGTRIYIYANEPSGATLTYYSYDTSLSAAPVEIRRVNSTTYRLYNGSTFLTTVYFDQGWTPTVASKWVASNHYGNQIPGTQSNAAYFLNATYQSQYGTGTFAGSLVLPTPFPLGAQFGTNSTGFWTRDKCG